MDVEKEEKVTVMEEAMMINKWISNTLKLFDKNRNSFFLLS